VASPSPAAKPAASPAASAVPSPSPAAAARAADGGLIGTWQWRSTQPASGAAIVVADPTRYWITFVADGSVQIKADCNRVLGSYRVNGAMLQILLGPSTMVGCPPDSQADEFTAGLAQVNSFVRIGDTLELGLQPGGRMVLAAVPEPELVGAPWQLLSYNNGRDALVSIQEGTQPTAEFAPDGTVSGSGGCNQFNGPYRTSGTDITMGPFATTRMACDQPIMDQELAYLEALTRATTYRFDDGQLRLLDSSDATQAVFAR
jgi:heat shock protein HslJ